MKSAEEFWSKLIKLDNGCWEKPTSSNCKTYYTALECRGDPWVTICLMSGRHDELVDMS